jgi:xanthine/uracil permease
MQRAGYLPAAHTTALWASAAALLGLSVATLLSWSISAAIPPWLHHNIVNRVLGVLPALLVGVMILMLGLGLADRLVDQPAQQAFLRSGRLTGPLIQLVDIGQAWITGVY